MFEADIERALAHHLFIRSIHLLTYHPSTVALRDTD